MLPLEEAKAARRRRQLMVLFVIGGYRRARPAELVASEGSEKRLEAACAACHGGRLRALVGIGLSVVQWLGAAVRSPLPATLSLEHSSLRR